MGMGSAPAHAWTITLDGLKQIIPKEIAEFEEHLASLGMDWDIFAKDVQISDFQDEIDDDAAKDLLLAKWDKLQCAFRLATLCLTEEHQISYSCLDLEIWHYCSDEGDRYDDLEDGAFFTVAGVTQLTPAAERIKEHLTEASWTVFG